MHRDTFASFVVTWIIMLLLALILLTGKPISPAIAPAVTNIYKKYYVAPPIEAPPVVIEGDYSEWTIYDSIVDTDLTYSVYAYDNYAVINLDETTMLFISAQDKKIKKYTIATKTLSANLFDIEETSGLQVGFAFGSAYGTYVAKITDDQNYIKILKNGDVIQTLSYTDLGLVSGGITACSVSPIGKYLVTGGADSENHWKWIVLMGS